MSYSFILLLHNRFLSKLRVSESKVILLVAKLPFFFFFFFFFTFLESCATPLVAALARLPLLISEQLLLRWPPTTKLFPCFQRLLERLSCKVLSSESHDFYLAPGRPLSSLLWWLSIGLHFLILTMFPYVQNNFFFLRGLNKWTRKASL